MTLCDSFQTSLVSKVIYYRNRLSRLLLLRECHNIVNIINDQKVLIIRVFQNLETLKPLYTVGGNKIWGNCYAKQLKFPQKNKIEFKYDVAILLLDIYPKQLKSESVRDKKTFLDRSTLWLLLSRFFQYLYL